MSNADSIETIKKNLESVAIMLRSIRGLAFYAFGGVAKDSPASLDLEALVCQTTSLLVYLESGSVFRGPEINKPIELVDGAVRPAIQH